jgi:hypothetical protein
MVKEGLGCTYAKKLIKASREVVEAMSETYGMESDNDV